jgi:hypothetical protein
METGRTSMRCRKRHAKEKVTEKGRTDTNDDRTQRKRQKQKRGQ